VKTDLIYGLQSVREALLAGVPIDKIYIRQGARNILAELKELPPSSQTTLQEVPAVKLDYLCPGRNHQGIVALRAAAAFVAYETLVPSLFESGKTPLLVGVEGVTDVRNIGAIARTAEAMGADCLLLPLKGTAPLGADALKTSSGALHHLPVCKVARWGTAFRFLQQSGLVIVACTEKSKTSITEVDLSGPLCLLMGAEDTGIPEPLQRLSNFRVKINLHGKIQSLNVSVAFGMAIYEVQRQRTMNR
jgi:23S rRNA (guanosine2251-2'-O)-methyltransferase